MNSPVAQSEHLTHTVSFSRKKNLGNYESEDATFFVQFDTPLGTAVDQIVQQAASAFAAAKISVLDTLDLPYQVDFDGSILQGVADAAQPATAPQLAAPAVAQLAAPVAPAAPAVAEADVMAAFPGAQVAARDDSKPPYDSYTKVKSERAANTAWAVRKFQEDPSGFFDNRAEKEPGSKRPDFKHKESGVAIWLDKNGQLPS